MQCGICEVDKKALSCSSCSQARAWELRYETLLRITERDAGGEKVQEYLESSRGDVGNIIVQNSEARERTRKLREEIVKLRERAVADSIKLQTLKKENSERHQRLEDAMKFREHLEQNAASAQRDTKRLNQKWKVLYTRTAEARSFLCREAAMLYGLRQKRKKSGKTEYMIGGVTIPNFLQDLNSHQYTQITTSLGHLSHLLVLTSHYLGLKLPHEIILPTRDTPHTLIRGILNNRHLATRPLYLSQPLSQLSRENTPAHTKFIEGISMLSINITWLCFSQGLEIVDVEDACKPGANMYRLLVAKDSAAAIGPGFGRTSHATANGNLATAAGQAHMARFKLGLKVVIEKVRYTLQGETIGQEWDLVPEVEREGAPGKVGMGIASILGDTDEEYEGVGRGRGRGRGRERERERERGRGRGRGKQRGRGSGEVVSPPRRRRENDAEIVASPSRRASMADMTTPSAGGSGGLSGWSQLQVASAGISGWTRIRSKGEQK